MNKNPYTFSKIENNTIVTNPLFDFDTQSLFSAIMNSTSDAVIITTTELHIVFLNQEAKKILAISDAEAQSNDVTTLFNLTYIDTDESLPIFDFVKTDTELKNKKTWLVNRHGKRYAIELNINKEVCDIQEKEFILFSFKDISQLYEMADTLKHQSIHDRLTGLLNRNELATRLNANLKRPQDQLQKTGIFYIDLDHFRIINDACGNAAGDQLLIETAKLIRSFMRAPDYAARLSGDDFVLVYHCLENDTVSEELSRIAQGLIQRMALNPFHWNGKTYPLTLSIGILVASDGFTSSHEISITGNHTVSMAHKAGGNKFLFHKNCKNNNLNSKTISEWISKVHNALKTDSFKLFYQPITPLKNDTSAQKVEVLLRMTDSNGEIISPAEFIPIAERYNLMASVDRWVIRNTLETISKFKKINHPLSNAKFSINLSGSSLADESVISYIIDATDFNNIDPSQICIEITESSAILNLTSASRFIHILKNLGFCFALDDFGSGFSSFNYLKNLSVDFLKIDGSFIRNMSKGSIDYTMVEAISSMCKVLGLKTIGEFAETPEIIELLTSIGLDYAQGFAISKPIPLEV